MAIERHSLEDGRCVDVRLVPKSYVLSVCADGSRVLSTGSRIAAFDCTPRARDEREREQRYLWLVDLEGPGLRTVPISRSIGRAWISDDGTRVFLAGRAEARGNLGVLAWDAAE